MEEHPGVCVFLAGWLAGWCLPYLHGETEGSGPDHAYPKGCRLTLPVFPQDPESCQRQKTALLFYKDWDPFSHEAHVEPLSLRCGADPALHLHQTDGVSGGLT